MKRKKWTARTEITDSLLEFREKRKWQIALRRYVVNRNICSFYAPYFALDIKNFRKWIEIQFDEDMNWDNFSKTWQFDHIVPVACFDFKREEELRLCWNFINIQVEKLQSDKSKRGRIDVLSAKAYFQDLYKKTQYHICRQMIDKIEKIETARIEDSRPLEKFIVDNALFLKTSSSFGSYEFENLNKGMSLEQIVQEKEFLKKYGS